MAAVSGWWDDFFWGSLVVVELFFVALFLTVIFGLVGAAAKLSKSRAAHSIASAYTVVFRGTPEILVLLLFYFGSAVTLTAIAQVFDPEIKFVDIPPFWAGSLAIALIVGSYATETFRGAFLGIDPGQVEAARALGLSNLKTFMYVRIPAMWRLALPPFGNHMLSLIKDTALIAIIGLEETLFVANRPLPPRASRSPCISWSARSIWDFQRSSPCRSWCLNATPTGIWRSRDEF